MGAQAVRLSNIDIDNALENKDFEVLFQPIFDLGNGALARMETFVRWRHPDLGVLPPGAFLSFFESQGRMSELTRYVLAEALNGYLQWRGPFAPGFSINLALTDLGDEAFAAHFTKLMRDREFPADLVTLECPMPPVDADLNLAAASFSRLRKTGARLAIEVRGRANEFLRSIDPFPFDEIKTGGSSILRFARTVRGPGLSAISDLLDIANKANAAITAVGVEDQASLSALRGLGFTAAQGNHLAKVGNLKEFLPSRVNEVRELLGLSALSADDLASLFRTSAPAPKAAETTQADEPKAAERTEAEQPAPLRPEAVETPPAEAEAPKETAEDKAQPAVSQEDDEKRARAREKARAFALAKRAKARESRKAAAIQRAKAKVAQAKQNETAQIGEPSAPQPASLAAVPRDLQERLAQEFAGAASGETKVKAPEAQIPAASAETLKPAAVPKTVKKNPAPAAQEPPLAAAGDQAAAMTTPVKTVRLGGGGVRAYLQPGIRIGGPAVNPIVNTSRTRRGAGLAAPLAPAPSPVAPAPAEPVQTQLALDEAPRGRQPAAAKKTLSGRNEKDVQGHLLEDDTAGAVLSQPKPAPRRRAKNFLTRKYRFRLPNHFWPKSWKRSLRRLRASRRTPEAAE